MLLPRTGHSWGVQSDVSPCRGDRDEDSCDENEKRKPARHASTVADRLSDNAEIHTILTPSLHPAAARQGSTGSHAWTRGRVGTGSSNRLAPTRPTAAPTRSRKSRLGMRAPADCSQPSPPFGTDAVSALAADVDS